MNQNVSGPLPRVGIVGASGYSGEELVGLLLRHPAIELSVITSRQYADKPLLDVFPRFAHFPRSKELKFKSPEIDILIENCDVVFLALPHGISSEFAVPLKEKGLKVIDLSADFRLRSPEVYEEFYGHPHPAPFLLSEAVYGLPEWHRGDIHGASLVASPGCYPTSILLPLLPLISRRLVRTTGIIADSLSGVSGAGRKADVNYLFVECHESLRPYGIPKHRHLSEIEQELSIAAGEEVIIQFTPHLVPVNRGILSTLYLAPVDHFGDTIAERALLQEIKVCYHDHYGKEPFIRLLEDGDWPDTKHVVGTNMIEIGWRLDPRTGRLIVVAAEDNLLKGASGQAVQSLNIILGLDETLGLVY